MRPDEPASRLNAADPGHGQVHQYDVDRVLLGYLQRRLPVAHRSHDVEPAVGQRGGKTLAEHGMVVRDDDAQRGLTHGRCTGSQAETRVPPPGVECTSAAPPTSKARA